MKFLHLKVILLSLCLPLKPALGRCVPPLVPPNIADFDPMPGGFATKAPDPRCPENQFWQEEETESVGQPDEPVPGTELTYGDCRHLCGSIEEPNALNGCVDDCLAGKGAPPQAALPEPRLLGPFLHTNPQWQPCVVRECYGIGSGRTAIPPGWAQGEKSPTACVNRCTLQHPNL